jgi:hypothetical protein
MFHAFFFHNGLRSCHCHNVLADAMALASAYKVEQDLQDRRRQEWEREEERFNDQKRI